MVTSPTGGHKLHCEMETKLNVVHMEGWKPK